MKEETVGFSVLKGLVLESFEEARGPDEIRIQASGKKFRMFHDQDCCETVDIESIHFVPESGKAKMIGETILDAVEYTMLDKRSDEGEGTYTYYTLRTDSVTITIRWWGTSNGYYSEEADFCRVLED